MTATTPSNRAPTRSAQAVPSSFGKVEDPSMNDILASIRRVLNEEETMPDPQTPAPNPAAAGKPGSDDVFLLDQSMLVAGASASPASLVPASPAPASAAPSSGGSGPVHDGMTLTGSGQAAGVAPGGMVAPSVTAAAASSVGQLLRQVSPRSPMPPQNDTRVEDLVLRALAPELKDWLEHNLEKLVERLVKAELRKVMNQAMADN